MSEQPSISTTTSEQPSISTIMAEQPSISTTMSLDCPDGNAHLTLTVHLTVTVAGGSTTPTPAATADSAPVEPPKPKKRPSARANPTFPTDAEFDRLMQLMCCPFPSFSTRKPAQPTMRPVVVVPDPADNDSVSDEVGLLTDPRARRTLTLVARRMYYTMRSLGDEYETADTLLKAPQRGHMALPPTMTAMPFRRVVLEAVGAIIYAMEWTQSGVDQPEIPWPPQGAGLLGPLEPGSRLLYPPSSGGWNNYRSRLRRLFEMMPVVDYGFQARPIRSGRTLEDAFVYEWSALESFADTLVWTAQAWRWRQLLPTDRHWTIFVDAALSWDDGFRGLKVPVWDIATMLFYYRLHREPGDLADHKHGWI